MFLMLLGLRQLPLTQVDNTRERPYHAGNPPIITKTQKRTSGKIIASSVDVLLTGLKIQVFYKTLKKPCRIKMFGTDVPFFPFFVSNRRELVGNGRDYEKIIKVRLVTVRKDDCCQIG